MQVFFPKRIFDVQLGFHDLNIIIGKLIPQTQPSPHQFELVIKSPQNGQAWMEVLFPLSFLLGLRHTSVQYEFRNRSVRIQNLKMKQVLWTLLLAAGLLASAASQTPCPQGQLPINNQCRDIYYREGCAAYASDNSCLQCQYSYTLTQGYCQRNPQETRDCCASYNSDGTCKQCSPGLFSQDPYCLKNEIYGCILKKENACLVCGKGLLFNQGTCNTPIDHCKSYQGGLCIKCEDNYALQQAYCVPKTDADFCLRSAPTGCLECREGYYLTSKLQCLKWAPGCLGYHQQQCLACKPSFKLSQGQCLIWGCKDYQLQGCLHCQDGFTLEDGKCYYQGCQNAVNNSCVECKQGYRLTQQGCKAEVPFQCQLCPTGFVFISGKCLRVIPGCEQYSPEGLCSKCKSPFQLAVNGQCQIVGCASYCAQGCQQCQPPFQLSNYQCGIPHCLKVSPQGCAQCEANYQMSQGQCIQQDPNCVKYDLVNGVSACLQCKDRFFLSQGQCKPAQRGCNYDQQGKCKCRAPFSLRQNTCQLLGCTKYDWETCLECQLPFQLNPQQNSCSIPYCSKYSWSGCNECQQGFILCQGTCRPQVPHCFSHTDQGQCQSCETGYLLSQGKCLKNIPNCQQWTADGASCQQCQQGYSFLQGQCLISIAHCSQQNEKGCLCCEASFHLSNYQCVGNEVNCVKYDRVKEGWDQCVQCRQGYFYSAQQQACVQEQPGCVYIGCDCVSCSKPFIYDSSAKACYLAGCQKYSMQGCLECLSPFQLSNGACSISNCLTYSKNSCTKCQDNFVLINSGICVLRDPHCSKYQGTQCCECQQGWTLNQGNCVIRDENCVKYGQNGLICTDCNEGFHPNEQGKCTPNSPGCIYSQGCCSSCRPPFQPASQNTCVIPNCQVLSPSGCSQCQSPFVLSSQATCQLQNCLRYGAQGCVQCKPLYHLKKGACESDDPLCLSYSAEGECQLCSGSTVLSSEGKCVQAGSCLQWCKQSSKKCLLCGAGYFLNRFFQCEKQDGKCDAYTNGVCSKCGPKYFLYNQICFPYSPGCVQYQGKDCTSCKAGYELRNGECFKWNNQGMALLGGDDHYDFDITPIDVRQSKYYINNLSPASAIGHYFFSSIYASQYNDCSLSTLEGPPSAGWRAAKNDSQQYIGVKLDGEPATFYALQLEAVSGNYIGEFYLEYSLDGQKFTRVQTAFSVPSSISDNLTTIYFTGIYAKAIRIWVSQWRGWPACRLEFFYYDMLRFRKISNLKSLTYLQETISSNFVDRVDNQLYINQVYFFNPSQACSVQQLCFTGLQLCEPRNVEALDLSFKGGSSINEFYLTYSVDGRKYNCYQGCKKFKVTPSGSSTFKLVLQDLKAQGVRIYPSSYSGSASFTPTFYYQ